MDIQELKKAFEDWVKNIGGLNSDFETGCNGQYKSDVIHFAWGAWQAGKAQAVPEGFVLMPKVITDDWMAAYIDSAVNEYCKDFKDLPFYVRENELPEVRENHQKPIRNAHKCLMQVIEAQEQKI